MLIDAKNVTKAFGAFKAVDNASVAVEEGDILGLIGRLPGPRQATPRGSAQHRRDRFQQAMIRRIIACHGRPHQAGPFVFTFAHARSHTAIRSIFQFVTPEPFDHEVVIETSPA